jgi:hypothetical protein
MFRRNGHDVPALRGRLRGDAFEGEIVRLGGPARKDDVFAPAANQGRDLLARPLDELKVDIVLHERGQPLSPIDRIARRDGVKL